MKAEDTATGTADIVDMNTTTGSTTGGNSDSYTVVLPELTNGVTVTAAYKAGVSGNNVGSVVPVVSNSDETITIAEDGTNSFTGGTSKVGVELTITKDGKTVTVDLLISIPV